MFEKNENVNDEMKKMALYWNFFLGNSAGVYYKLNGIKFFSNAVKLVSRAVYSIVYLVSV